MIMKTFGLIVMLLMTVSLVGCESLRGTFGSLGSVFGVAQNTIEATLAAQVAGEYVVEIRKDGEVLLAEAWTCTKGEDGKLSGCHKK